MKPGPWRGREGLETSSRRRGGWGMSWRCTRPIGRRGRDVRGTRKKAGLMVARALAVIPGCVVAVRTGSATGVLGSTRAGSTVAGPLATTRSLVVARRAGRAGRAGPVALGVLPLCVVTLPVVVVRAVVPGPLVGVVGRVVMDRVRSVLMTAVRAPRVGV